MVGDGSWLMMSSEIVTSVQEGFKLTVLLLDNHGFQSIGGLSHAIGSGGFGTRYRFRSAKTGHLDGPNVPVDYAASAASLGAHVITARDLDELKEALAKARKQTKTTVIVVETDPEKRVPGYESGWDVPIAEISEIASVRAAASGKGDRRTHLWEFHHEREQRPQLPELRRRLVSFPRVRFLDVPNPATGEVWRGLPSPKAEVDQAVRSASAAFADWRRTPSGPGAHSISFQTKEPCSNSISRSRPPSPWSAGALESVARFAGR